MLHRVGVFLAVLGVTTLALFFLSDMARQPNGWLLFYGIVLLGLAFGILRATRAPGSQPERFRLMRRLFGGQKASPPPPPASAPPPDKPSRGLFGRKK